MALAVIEKSQIYAFDMLVKYYFYTLTVSYKVNILYVDQKSKIATNTGESFI
jgi:hypothetical protein